MTCSTICCAGETRFDPVIAILARHDHDPARLIPILQEAQHAYRYLPEDVLIYIAVALAVPPARVFGVATFYAHFTLSPKGKHVIRLCDGTACHVKGSQKILDAMRTRLGMHGSASTTEDMQFTVETVSCLGACGLAPVMTVNEAVHGQVTAAAAVAVIDQLIADDNTNTDEEEVA